MVNHECQCFECTEERTFLNKGKRELEKERETMGDRGAIQFVHDGGSVVMYTHWQGHKVEEMLRGAMCMVEEGGRLHDPVYAIRIFMQHCWTD